MSNDAPRWTMESIFTGQEDTRYIDGVERLRTGGLELVEIAGTVSRESVDTPHQVRRYLDIWNEIGDLYEELSSFAYCRFSVNTDDGVATRELNRIEELGLPIQNGTTIFRHNLAALDDKTKALVLSSNEDAAFFLEEQIQLARYQMSPDLEDLAADLTRSGADAWQRLQESLSSSLEVIWDANTGEKKTVIELRALAYSPDREVREKAYRLELEAWKQVETPMAYALNGVKGSTIVLNERRGYRTSTEPALMLSRITGKTLDALIDAMKQSLPEFRRYFKTKARLLGADSLRFYDLFAPVGESELTWTFDEAARFITTHFAKFSTRLGDFAASAFKHRWIDAKTRNGKVGGAYCISFPLAKESRILCNFDGSLSSVLTIAHELGHAYHHEVLKDTPRFSREYPMTLAETASIFCEFIVLNAALEVSSQSDRQTISEQFLQDAAQIIVDILSRFLFESRIFEERVEYELTPQDFCERMLEAQRDTYGDGLDADFLHPYMWAVKGHYYSQGLPYYNFPYAFGMLFGTGLYELYRAGDADFVSQYDRILEGTGSATANELTSNSGFDIENVEFWLGGIRRALAFIELL